MRPERRLGREERAIGEAYELEQSRRVYAGEVIGLRVDTVRFPDGTLHEREVVEHPGAVGILPVIDQGAVALVRQYRQPVGQEVLEIPAGLLDEGESALECAMRELREETGYTAGRLVEVCGFYMSPGYSDERFRLFAAYDLTAGPAAPDGEERIRLKKIRRGELASLVALGAVQDAKTLIALQFWCPGFLVGTPADD